jgi:hypothetical protein
MYLRVFQRVSMNLRENLLRETPGICGEILYEYKVDNRNFIKIPFLIFAFCLAGSAKVSWSFGFLAMSKASKVALLFCKVLVSFLWSWTMFCHDNTPRVRSIFSKISKQLRFSQKISKYLRFSQKISKYLRFSQKISKNLKKSQTISKHLPCVSSDVISLAARF